MAEFFNMDGYASYVWSAYGVTLAIIIWMVGSTVRRRLKTKEEEERLSRPS